MRSQSECVQARVFLGCLQTKGLTPLADQLEAYVEVVNAGLIILGSQVRLGPIFPCKLVLEEIKNMATGDSQ